MVEFLMNSGENVTMPEILATADRLGLDNAEFVATMDSPEIDALIQTDVMRGKRWGLRSVPAIFVNGKHIPRWNIENENVVERVVKIAVTGEGD